VRLLAHSSPLNAPQPCSARNVRVVGGLRVDAWNVEPPQEPSSLCF
jgi:hypothetical protein